MEKPLNFVLIGRSGSGKGTQAELLMKHFGDFLHVITGDLFRSLAKADSHVGEIIRKILQEGGLPYDDLATTLWMHEIAFNLKSSQGLMADGFPRRLPEAKNLDRFLEFLSRKENTFYLLIDISREEAFSRLTKRRICKKCGKLIPWVGVFRELKVCDNCGGELMTRADDKPEAINNRLDYYEKSVVPVVEYYKEQGKLININGEQPIENVFKDILKAIK
ncbi:MAG: nucleoside monophosphate kinase [Candidatus Nealsonbacteria bacterium]|nr:nucleoside monophosphate kinase [Candidatus Nealsonbacteria bacterium]